MRRSCALFRTALARDFEWDAVRALERGIECVVGCDEAGTGPLAGPLTVAAVQVSREMPQFLKDVYIQDSKKMTTLQRGRALLPFTGKNTFFELFQHSQEALQAHPLTSFDSRNGLPSTLNLTEVLDTLTPTLFTYSFLRCEGDDLSHFVHWAVSIANHSFIDKINVHQAAMLGMISTIAALGNSTFNVHPTLVLVDGGEIPSVLKSRPEVLTQQRTSWAIPSVHNAIVSRALRAQTVVQGDSKSYSIAAASVLAKVLRDECMIHLADKYPGYELERNKGYGSKCHKNALREKGRSPIHRETFHTT